MMKDFSNEQVPDIMLRKYFKFLVNRFFKILPIREKEENTFPVYVKSLQSEILGCKEFIGELNNDSNILTLLSILQFFADNPDCPVKDVKREVFKAISICNKLESLYTKAGEV